MQPTPATLQRWRARQADAASHRNEVLDAVDALRMPMDGVSPAWIPPSNARLGIVTNAGPNGEADWTDERYWIKDAVIQGTDYDAPTASLSAVEYAPAVDANGGTTDGAYPRCATNLAEIAAGSHLLATDGTQIVWYWQEVAMRSDGAADERWLMVAPPPGLFPVKVTKDGGSDGTSSAAASWTYTVKTLAGSTLGTGVAVTRPRPNGKMTYQSGSSGYGLAFYDGTTLKLWDAGEVPTSGACT